MNEFFTKWIIHNRLRNRALSQLYLNKIYKEKKTKRNQAQRNMHVFLCHSHTPPPKATAILTSNAEDLFCLAWNGTSAELYRMYYFVSDFFCLILISHLCWTPIFTSVCVCLVTQSCPTLCNPVDCSLPGSSSPLDSPGKNRSELHTLLWEIFPTQGSNPGLPHFGWILYCLSHQGSPRILEWVVYPFSRGSSWFRNQTGASCIASGFFTSWATRKVTKYW